MASKRIIAGLALLLACASAGLSANGQDHEEQGLAPFEPADIRPYDDWATPKSGFFFCFDGIYWNISAPHRTSIGDPTLTPTVYTSAADSFVETNSVDTGFIRPLYKWGDRLEGGYMDEHSGFEFTTLQTNSHTNQFFSQDDYVVFNAPAQGATGVNLLDIVFTRDPVTGLPLTVGESPVNFNTLTVINKTRFSDFEALYLYRPYQLPNGGDLVIGAGGRYFQLKDQLFVDAEGGALADSYWNTTTHNDIVGPEISARISKQVGRFSVSSEARFAACVNTETVHQDGILASTLQASNAFPLPTLMSKTGFTNSALFTEFTPIVELRAEGHVQLTNLISAKVGWTGTWMNNVGRSADLVNYTVPNMGITTTNGGATQSVFMQGLNIGIELNR